MQTKNTVQWFVAGDVMTCRAKIIKLLSLYGNLLRLHFVTHTGLGYSVSVYLSYVTHVMYFVP